MEPFACNEIHIEQQHANGDVSAWWEREVRVTCWLYWALQDHLVSMFWQWDESMFSPVSTPGCSAQCTQTGVAVGIGGSGWIHIAFMLAQAGLKDWTKGVWNTTPCWKAWGYKEPFLLHVSQVSGVSRRKRGSGIPLPSPIVGAWVVQERAEHGWSRNKRNKCVASFKSQKGRGLLCALSRKHGGSLALPQIQGMLQPQLCPDRNRSAVLTSTLCPFSLSLFFPSLLGDFTTTSHAFSSHCGFVFLTQEMGLSPAPTAEGKTTAWETLHKTPEVTDLAGEAVAAGG